MKQSSEGSDDEIDLKKLFSLLWQAKLSIVTITLLGAALSVGYALSLPNLYTSEAILVPKSENIGTSSMAGQFGGLAGLAGINVGGGEVSKTQVAIATLQSRGFFAEYIYEDVLVPLMATERWDAASNELIINKNIYDAKDDNWGGTSLLPESKPSIQVAFRSFSAAVTVSQDQRTGFISLKAKHYSPTVAKEWIEIMLEAIDRSVRQRDVAEAEKSITFLKAQSATISLISLNQVFASLIEEHTKKIVLANSSEEYLFQVIEPPVAAELKSEPNRASICILGFLLASMLAVILVLIKHYFFDKMVFDDNLMVSE
jgi:capsular polysaccharide biosynthesis protein